MNPKIIFEDEYLLVLDKPAGMIVNKSDTTKDEVTLQDWVEKYLKIPRPPATSTNQIANKSSNVAGEVGRENTKLQIPNRSQIQNYNEQAKVDFVNRAGIVHRLDKETSGIILVAKTPEAFVNLQSQFKERKVQKTYLALAHGKIEPEKGIIDVEVGRLPWNRKRFGVLSGGRGSVTEYKVLRIKYLVSGENKEPLSLVELSPKTGRTHQIRVHLQYIKHPIFGDPLYAGRKTGRNDRKLLPRVFLHASKISFTHPASYARQALAASHSLAGGLACEVVAGRPKTNESLSFESPLPDELQIFLKNLLEV